MTGENNESFTIRLLIAVLWADKKFIAATTSIAIILSLGIALFTDPIYRSVVVTSPRIIDPTSDLSVSGLGSKLGGLSNLLSAGPLSQDISKNLTILNARSTINTFFEKSDILSYMYKDDWDWDTQSWKTNPPPLLVQRFHQFLDWITEETSPRTYDHTPSEEVAYLAFKNWHENWYDEKKNLSYVAFYGPTGELAAKWATEYVALTNSIIQKNRLKEAETRIAYFEKMLNSVKFSEVRSNLMQRLAKDLNIQTIANITDEFAFETLDPAIASEFRYWPKRSLIMILGTIIGISLAILISLFRYLYLNNKYPAIKEENFE